jgi:hypothetical protein
LRPNWSVSRLILSLQREGSPRSVPPSKRPARSQLSCW